MLCLKGKISSHLSDYQSCKSLNIHIGVKKSHISVGPNSFNLLPAIVSTTLMYLN